jgi:PEP-CTERM motif
MHLPFKVLSLAALLAIPLASKADTLDFTLTGGGNTFTFSLPSNPTPDSTNPGVSFTLDDIMVALNPGSPLSIDFTADLTFSNLGSGGGISFPIPSPPPTNVDLDLVGAQLFTGTLNSPIFAPTTTPFLLSEPKGTDTFSLDIASEIPEPSTIAFLGTGLVALAGAARRKLTAN